MAEKNNTPTSETSSIATMEPTKQAVKTIHRRKTLEAAIDKLPSGKFAVTAYVGTPRAKTVEYDKADLAKQAQSVASARIALEFAETALFKNKDNVDANSTAVIGRMLLERKSREAMAELDVKKESELTLHHRMLVVDMLDDEWVADTIENLRLYLKCIQILRDTKTPLAGGITGMEIATDMLQALFPLNGKQQVTNVREKIKKARGDAPTLAA